MAIITNLTVIMISAALKVCMIVYSVVEQLSLTTYHGRVEAAG